MSNEKNEFTSFSDLIDYALELEEQSRGFYNLLFRDQKFQDIKGLIMSLFEQNKEHIKRFAELRQSGSIADLFKGNLQNCRKQDFELKEGQKEKSEFLAGLSRIIRWQDVFIKLYSLLDEGCTNQDASFLFRRLADECLKQKAMFLNRYELELIKTS